MADQAPVAVVASSQERADKLIRELGLSNASAVCSTADPTTIEGMRLSAVLIDKSALPLTNPVGLALQANLVKTPGHGGMYEVGLHGPSIYHRS